MKKIWIDITNSPHAIFYNAMIPKIEKNGYKVVVTARDYAQTIELLDLFDIEYKLIGKHQGKNKIKKLFGLFTRSIALIKFAKGQHFDGALSMSSQYVMIAARMLKIPHMTLFDYEYSTGHKISFRLSTRILSPAGVSAEELKKYGASMNKVTYYNGLKEQFFINHYIKLYNNKYHGINPLKEKLNVDTSRVIIVVRPEATVAHYQSNKNSLTADLLSYLDMHISNPLVILLPRINSQREEYKAMNFKNVIIPEIAINGVDLVASCDLVIGAGGSMNREAASIGIPVYTLYQGGEFCAVDNMLIETNRMIRISKKEDFGRINVIKRKNEINIMGEDLSKLYITELKGLIGDA